MFDLDEAREYFKGDRYAVELTGIVIDEIGDGYARVSCRMTPDHLNARGFVMGGVMYTMADFAFAVAANCGTQEVVTLQNQMSYLAPAKDETLYAEANCIKGGKTVCLYEVAVTDSSGRLVAHSTVNGFVVGARD